MKLQGLVRVGRCGRPHGVKGNVTVHLDNPGSDVLARAREVVIERDASHRETFNVIHATPRDSVRWLVTLEGVDTRKAASILTNTALMVDRADLGLSEQEFLVSDLPGREVKEADTTVGTVRSVYWNGAHDVLVVATERGLVDFPLVTQHVTGLDDDGRLAVSGFAPFLDLAYEPATESEN